MKITLLLKHTALIEDDRKTIVTVSPPCAGMVSVQGKTIRTGDVMPPLFSGRCTLTFTADNGEIYTDTNVIVGRDGVPHEHIDSSRMVEVLVMLDQIIRKQTDHTAQLNRIEGRASGGIFELFRPKNQNQEDNNNA
jgi:hypothetical protein